MKYLGLDWGLKKIGLALSEGEIASPFVTLKVKSLQDAIKQILDIVDHGQIKVVVIGQPEGKMGEVVDKVAGLLQRKKVKVAPADETLSSQDAKAEMIRLGLSKKARRDDNAMAAALILQRFLDEKK